MSSRRLRAQAGRPRRRRHVHPARLIFLNVVSLEAEQIAAIVVAANAIVSVLVRFVVIPTRSAETPTG
jgi:hypothetical protein